MARIAITGATGTIGNAVCRALIARGDIPVALARDTERAATALPAGTELHAWPNPMVNEPPSAALKGAAGVIHLLGEPIAQRWTAASRAAVHDSRIRSTLMLVAAMRTLDDTERPAALVSQSATGYYGASGDRELDEESAAGNDFLAGVVSEWEAEALAANTIARVVTTRTGVVLSPSGGALAKMLPFFRAGVGGPIAGGHQYVPWIHIDDVVTGLLFCLDTASTSGPVNLTAPVPVTNAELSRTLGRVLHRPAVLPVPAVALRLLYGEMSTVVTTGQRAVPRRLEKLGFAFRHPELESALRDVLT
jgi:uncharacterized protein (TIGR01777 family)